MKVRHLPGDQRPVVAGPPCSVAPVFRAIDVRAMIVPLKLVVVSGVAELPTCQETLQAGAPLMSAVLMVAVMTTA